MNRKGQSFLEPKVITWKLRFLVNTLLVSFNTQAFAVQLIQELWVLSETLMLIICPTAQLSFLQFKYSFFVL